MYKVYGCLKILFEKCLPLYSPHIIIRQSGGRFCVSRLLIGFPNFHPPSAPSSMVCVAVQGIVCFGHALRYR